jgi:hypothetical protein
MPRKDGFGIVLSLRTHNTLSLVIEIINLFVSYKFYSTLNKITQFWLVESSTINLIVLCKSTY